MSLMIESIATIVLLILVMIFITHLLKGDAKEWIVSKYAASDNQGSVISSLS
jgi:hypothetical protein